MSSSPKKNEKAAPEEVPAPAVEKSSVKVGAKKKKEAAEKTAASGKSAPKKEPAPKKAASAKSAEVKAAAAKPAAPKTEAAAKKERAGAGVLTALGLPVYDGKKQVSLVQTFFSRIAGRYAAWGDSGHGCSTGKRDRGRHRA